LPGRLRLTNRVNGEIESTPLFLEQRSLRHTREIRRLGPQQPFDAAQRHADELQRHDLLETATSPLPIDTARRRCGLSSETVVVWSAGH
jgi:hypothetical protein